MSTKVVILYLGIMCYYLWPIKKGGINPPPSSHPEKDYLAGVKTASIVTVKPAIPMSAVATVRSPVP